MSEFRSRGALGVPPVNPHHLSYDTICQQLPIAACVCDADGVVVQCNRQAAELWSRSPSELPGGRLPLDPAPLAEMLRTGRPQRDVALPLERPDGTRVMLLASIEPMQDESGAIVGAICCLRRDGGPELTAKAEPSADAMLEALPAAIYTTDAGGRITFYNEAAATLAGRRPCIGRDQWCVTWRLYRPDGSALPHDQCPMAIALKENRPVHGAEIVAERPDGARVPVLAYPTPLRDSSGALVGAINMLVDIGELKEAEERRQLLIGELNHRVKNTLATVLSIAAQSFRGAAQDESYRRFERRLLALARAQDLLTRENWHSAEIRDIVAQALPLRETGADRFVVQGPGLRLAPKKALTLAMALHELCANAETFGALSNGQGAVTVEWDLAAADAEARLRFRWAERGGPRVQPPRRKGFGSRMIERGLARELGGEVRLDYAPGGLICEIEAPLA